MINNGNTLRYEYTKKRDALDVSKYINEIDNLISDNKDVGNITWAEKEKNLLSDIQKEKITNELESYGYNVFRMEYGSDFWTIKISWN